MSFPLDLRIGVIKGVKDHPNADRLYLIEVDLGDERRNLVAGLKQYYTPDELIGKKVVVLCNLKPAKIRGVESQGMLLAADDGRNVAILTTEASAGTRVLPEDEKGQKESSFREISIDEFASLDLKIKNNVAYYENRKLLAGWEELRPDRNVENDARIR